MREYVDIIVPRGGKELIERLARESRIPMIKHLDGVCHVYIDDSADPEMAVRIADNAKTQRYGTCNTMETLLVAEGDRRQGAARDRHPSSRARASRCARDAAVAEVSSRARRRPRRTTTPSGSRRWSRSAWSRASTRRSRTSPSTARSTPTPSSPSDQRARRALPARGRLELGDVERLDALRRRLRVRPRRRDRHLHRQAARARPGRPRRPHHAEVRRARPRRDPQPEQSASSAAPSTRSTTRTWRWRAPRSASCSLDEAAVHARPARRATATPRGGERRAPARDAAPRPCGRASLRDRSRASSPRAPRATPSTRCASCALELGARRRSGC